MDKFIFSYVICLHIELKTTSSLFTSLLILVHGKKYLCLSIYLSMTIYLLSPRISTNIAFQNETIKKLQCTCYHSWGHIIKQNECKGFENLILIRRIVYTVSFSTHFRYRHYIRTTTIPLIITSHYPRTISK